MSLILVGDIGGTKTTFVLYDYSEQSPQCINQLTYTSHDFNQFNDILVHLMNKMGINTIDILSLSIAGPILNNECHTTNLPWHISANTIHQAIKVDQIILLNGIEATGYGLLALSNEDLIQINPMAQFRSANRGIISIGTGLGEAFLFWDGGKYIPCGTEGGHTDFAPLIDSDIPLWQYLNQQFNGHISYERLISGPGILLIYEYLCRQNKLSNDKLINKTSAWISSQAIQKTDKLSIECMDIFIRFLANESANLCLKSMATGGIYITGGIAPKILPLLTQPVFLSFFCEKGRFKELMQTIPIWINKSEHSPLDGALDRAIKVIKS